MTTEQLTDYLINNDYEITIIDRDYDCIAQNLEAEGIDVTREQIIAAVDEANNDPYISLNYGMTTMHKEANA